MKAKSINEAWNMANEIFDTDYMKDDKASQNAGYPIYWSTAEGVNAWISDLGDRLEVNQNGKSVNIWIEEEPETEPAEVETEKTVRIMFNTTETKKNEKTTVEMEAVITFGINTRFTEIAEFTADANRIITKALKATKAGNTFSLTVSESKYKWTNKGGAKFPELETKAYNAWEAAPVWEQDPNENYIYFRPDTKYTPEHRDMIIRKGHIIEDLAEYIG